MKIISSLALLASCTAAVASADRKFSHNDTDHGNSTHKIKTAANFGNGGAKIELCPSGDCTTGQLVTLSMSRLEELDSKNKTIVKAPNFNSLNDSWSDFYTHVVNGVDVSSSSYVSNFTVGDANVIFNLTASIYSANGTTMNGNQSISVPAGALKFSVSISSWPFGNVANRLSFGINLKARGKGSKDQDAPTKKPKGGNHTDIDRVSMGEGMFMDAPTLAVIDGVDTAIESSMETKGGKTEFVWTFPHYTTSVYYDPVTGSEDASASPTTTTSDTPTPTPSPTNDAIGWRNVASSVTAACFTAATVAFLF